ncbi:hypothetical protein Glove_103g224 [Diversispora epigaea]|uniref:Uncharacterized protein n=1 Tax=Diversispora epigaea TaxID=1348612 RepID=A0A397J9Y5_9GLOM|nr:hypothetical protein Glove_103g224 [Diversispora epigaea]
MTKLEHAKSTGYERKVRAYPDSQGQNMQSRLQAGTCKVDWTGLNIKQTNQDDEMIQKHISEHNEEQHNEILKNAIVRDQVIRATLTEHLSRKQPAEEAPVITPTSGDLFQPDITNTEDDNCFNDCDESDNVSTEVQRFITKMKEMKGEKHRLFEYHIVNLSEKILEDPVNKVFSNEDKKKNAKALEKKRKTIVYVMHRVEGLYIVEILTNFIIPNTYVLEEIIIFKVYFFKVTGLC